MNQISLLSQETIDKIAAGEVVERPASIVKELVENAIDAGANAVTVEIKDGGTSLIRITDNGSGIPKDQVQIAFLRHATSKIRSVDDLLVSGTLGFRGEALSSIAAVCQVELITKTAGSLTGVRYCIEGGVEKSMEEIGAPEGTTFLVRNLFYNTPARKKFLKSATTEAGYVSDLMERMALSHPEISFKFINNRDTKLHTSGNSNLKDIIYGVYGREIAANVVKLETGNEEIQISGFIGKPVISRGNRNYENYFVNGRYVKSAIVARAIEDAYKPFMMSHRYPFTVLSIDINTSHVDVNVHPTKMEVRFANQAQVYDQVYQAVKDGLMGRELIPEFTIDEKKVTGKKASEEAMVRKAVDAAPERNAVEEIPVRKAADVVSKRKTENAMPNSTGSSPIQSMKGVAPSRQNGDTPEKRNAISSKETYASNTTSQSAKKERVSYPEPFEKVRSQLLRESTSPYEIKYPQMERRHGVMKPVTGNVVPLTGQTANLGNGPSTDEAKVNSGNEMPAGGSKVVSENTMQHDESKIDSGKESPAVKPSVDLKNTSLENDSAIKAGVQMELFDNRLLSAENLKRHKLIGQVFDTYRLVEFDEKLFIIDQHAAHEKVLYERFMQQLEKKEQTSQMITPPVIVTLSMQEESLLKQHMDQFTSVGFEIEHFGGREYSIRAVPGNLYGIADKTLFLELLDGLNDVSERSSSEAICEKIASMSCKAAVKGKMKLSVTEADALIAELLTLENPYNCPHGRPTIISMTKYEMEKKFKRIV